MGAGSATICLPPSTRGRRGFLAQLLLLSGRWRGGRGCTRLTIVHYVAELNCGAAFVSLVILILHGHADRDILAALEMQGIGSAGVGGEPVLLIDLFAVCLEFRKDLVAHPHSTLELQLAVQPHNQDGIVRARNLAHKSPRNPGLRARLRIRDQNLRPRGLLEAPLDRKSTRLNSSHLGISYA